MGRPVTTCDDLRRETPPPAAPVAAWAEPEPAAVETAPEATEPVVMLSAEISFGGDGEDEGGGDGAWGMQEAVTQLREMERLAAELEAALVEERRGAPHPRTHTRHTSLPLTYRNTFYPS